MKKIIRKIIPRQIRFLIWRMIPKLHKINTYILKNPKLITNLRPIDNKYEIRQITWDDEQKLKGFYSDPKLYASKIPKRMNSPEWVGLTVIDKTNGKMAYLSWVIENSIPYFEEFGIGKNDGRYFLKDILVKPEYRQQGLNSRMEQERINYCVRKNCQQIFIQIHNSHPIMNDVVKNNGYILYKQNYVIQWPVFHVYRSLKGFSRNPLKKIVN